ncbi:2-hydroxyacyl-CoA lyase 1 [Dimargaris xerosporica]|nr:2-hydroxyacyl-CoA lyase 1 [Dimargaris xerosporica]
MLLDLEPLSRVGSVPLPTSSDYERLALAMRAHYHNRIPWSQAIVYWYLALQQLVHQWADLPPLPRPSLESFIAEPPVVVNVTLDLVGANHLHEVPDAVLNTTEERTLRWTCRCGSSLVSFNLSHLGSTATTRPRDQFALAMSPCLLPLMPDVAALLDALIPLDQPYCTRFNGMLHFGQRSRSDVKITQADVCPKELGHNRPAHLALAGDLSVTVAQLVQAIKTNPRLVLFDAAHSAYWASLASRIQRNRAKLAAQCADNAAPLSYHRAFTEIKTALQPIYDQVVLMSQGTNAMDIARGIIDPTPIINVINNSGIQRGVASKVDYLVKARSHAVLGQRQYLTWLTNQQSIAMG